MNLRETPKVSDFISIYGPLVVPLGGLDCSVNCNCNVREFFSPARHHSKCVSLWNQNLSFCAIGSVICGNESVHKSLCVDLLGLERVVISDGTKVKNIVHYAVDL